MSGIVVTGGCAQTANLGNLIYDISGYRVRTGYPKHLFSFEGCEGITDTSAATSLGLVMAAKDDHTINCAVAKDGYVPEMTVPEPEPVKDPETLLQFETVEVPEKQTSGSNKKPEKPKKDRVKWNPIASCGKFFGSLYDSVHQEMEEIENEEA